MILKDKVVVFTGKISMPRHEAWVLLTKVGGIPGSDISLGTDYLVVGEKPGSKLIRAQALNIKIISEPEFHNLLKEEELDEEPLDYEALAELGAHFITLKCKYCGRDYTQWAKLPDTETCPTCEILLPVPKCPHCKNLVTYITDYNLYHCMLCGTWFKDHSSALARTMKHLCYFQEDRRTPEGTFKTCLACRKQIFVSNEESQIRKEKYNRAPALIEEWEERDLALGKAKKTEMEEKFNSLTDAQKLDFLTFLEEANHDN